MCSTLVVIVVHVLFRVEDRAGSERVALVSWIVVNGVCEGTLNVRLAVLVGLV